MFYSLLTNNLDPFLPRVLTRIVLSFCDVVLLSTSATDAKNDELLPAPSGRYASLQYADKDFLEHLCVGMRLDAKKSQHHEWNTGTITSVFKLLVMPGWKRVITALENGPITKTHTTAFRFDLMVLMRACTTLIPTHAFPRTPTALDVTTKCHRDCNRFYRNGATKISGVFLVTIRTSAQAFGIPGPIWTSIPSKYKVLETLLSSLFVI